MFAFFTKMQSLGNDFVVFDSRHSENKMDFTKKEICNIADRRYGVGCDQVAIIRSHFCRDFCMEIYNSDGSLAEICGNALRCVSLLEKKKKVEIATHDRVSVVLKYSPERIAVRIDPARFDWRSIPMSEDPGEQNVSFDDPVYKKGIAVNVGNPHLVFFLKNINDIDLQRLGPRFEKDPIFPQGVNVSFAEVIGHGAIALRTWERGAGETTACGTAACATFAAAKKFFLVRNKKVIIRSKGGDLHVKNDENGYIISAGPASIVFKGIWQY